MCTATIRRLAILTGGIGFSACLALAQEAGPDPNPDPASEVSFEGSPEFAPPEDIAPPAEPMTIETIHEVLDPYGDWVEIDGLGPCWRPSVATVGTDFIPYCDGRWVYCDYGWSWCSSYPWGWIPFHYGRWYRSPCYGWVWWPETCWGPAWVRWRRCEEFWGWAPCGPCGTEGLFIAAVPSDFVFVLETRFCAPNIARVRCSPQLGAALVARSVAVRGGAETSRGDRRPFEVRGGPAPDVVARAVGHAMRPARAAPELSRARRSLPREVRTALPPPEPQPFEPRSLAPRSSPPPESRIAPAPPRRERVLDAPRPAPPPHWRLDPPRPAPRIVFPPASERTAPPRIRLPLPEMPRVRVEPRAPRASPSSDPAPGRDRRRPLDAGRFRSP
jgi:hypothetical protein